jgi:triosephosphate isomerase
MAETTIVGNWKMFGSRAMAERFVAGLTMTAGAVELVVCAPAGLIPVLAPDLLQRGIGLGGQDCHPNAEGAHTGDTSAALLADLGARYVIVGHSERRRDHGETDALVRAKAVAALSAGLTPIICVGETLAERDSGTATQVVFAQIAGSVPPGDVVIAYEPVWAIGTGRTASAEDIAEMHAMVREQVGKGTRLLYGGSVKPSNAAEILAIANVDGALVGGASLSAADWLAIAAAAPTR